MSEDWCAFIRDREEWGVKVTNPKFADYGRVYPMESATEAERWAANRNAAAAESKGDSPELVRVHRTITTTPWEKA